jgi:hypothetical protein
LLALAALTGFGALAASGILGEGDGIDHIGAAAKTGADETILAGCLPKQRSKSNG